MSSNPGSGDAPRAGQLSWCFAYIAAARLPRRTPGTPGQGDAMLTAYLDTCAVIGLVKGDLLPDDLFAFNSILEAGSTVMTRTLQHSLLASVLSATAPTAMPSENG
jgi:hypothetical protein